VHVALILGLPGSTFAELVVRSTERVMRYSSCILSFMTAVLAGCAPSATSPATQPSSSIVGTWQWVRVDQQAVNEPFYVRYYPDGTACTWPAPSGWTTTTNGVSHGRYHLTGEFLVIETGAGTNDPKTHVEIKSNEMTLISDESNRLLYHRVVPDLEPGKLQPGQVSHGAPEL
jgi:hypothetical protein